jgi:phage baseplate assembly protein V
MTYVSRSRATDRRFYGVYEAIVTRVSDGDREDRVRVRYPWFHEEMESEWARVLQFFAGPGHGSYFIPEVGSEVLVACIHGDLRLPVVLGGLYNGQDIPPAEHVRVRKLRSVKGHGFTIYDSNGPSEGGLVIEDSSGCRITLSATGTIRITAPGAVQIDAPIVTVNGKVASSNSPTF